MAGNRQAPPPPQRALPHNYEAEQAFLGALLANNEVYHRASHFLRPEHFADPLHGRIYEAMARLITKGAVANPVTLKNLFDQDGALADIGGAQYLVQLAQAVVTVISAEDYAYAVRDLAVRRQLIAFAAELTEDAHIINPMESPFDLITQSETALYRINEFSAGRTANRARPAAEYLDMALATADAAHRRQDVAGVKTGLADVDEIIGALVPGTMTVLAGRPSMGKTSLALAILDNAEKSGVPSAFFSLEMSAEQLGLKHLSLRSGISSDLARKGRLTDMEIGLLIDHARQMQAMRTYIDDTAPLSVPEIWARSRQLKQKFGVGLIIIDYMQLCEPANKRDSRTSEMTDISRGLRGIAKDLDVPVIALSQLSRDVEKRPNKRPMLSDLRESGAIEQDADNVAFLFREEYYHDQQKPHSDGPEMQDWRDQAERIAGKAELILAKNRLGPLGTVRLRFEKSCTRFSDLREGDTDPAEQASLEGFDQTRGG